MVHQGFDIIGDVHGCGSTLERLLQELGYIDTASTGHWPVYAHATRKAIFLGDIVDRGPRIRESLHIVKAMVDAGAAQCLLGNHEYNALAYTTPAPEGSGKTYVREHNKRHNWLIAETLNQFAGYPEEWRMFLDWFHTLPVFIEFDTFRAVHACWDGEFIAEFRCKYPENNVISRLFVEESAIKGSFPQRFLDRLTRGTDLTLPEGRHITGRDGLERKAFRTKFWADSPETFQDVAFQPDPLPADIGSLPLNTEQKRSLLSYSETEKPVFVGHYWLQGEPEPVKKNLACLDYSAVKYGRLACYRYDGETQLDKSKFVWINVTQDLRNTDTP
ncbi:metallophosphoesterase [Teredinibacter haidensis]|mgnify:CR=1 FL=1|uniref:metallophosphoesterase n=1 Tax=Teredinibacter haidensis TaxID=2731755 RepID=UPI0009489B6F|nr:metallophosphoesterase [Teredinibacter haidensis]